MKRLQYPLIAIILLLTGCTSTYITSSWTAPNAKIRNYDKILVLGIMSDSSRGLRQSMEKSLVDDLREKGINASSAFEVYGPQAFKRMTEEQVTEQIKKKGYDGAITISLLNKEKEKYYVPGDLTYTPFGYNYGFFWGYYGSMYDRIYEPGYYDVATNYLWESNLYDLSNGKLIYSVQSKSFDPESLSAAGNDYARNIVKDLVKNGLIAKGKPEK